MYGPTPPSTAGGVGLATVELARFLGAGRVVAACGSDEKLALAASRGAEAEGINYRGLDGRAFRARLKEVAGAGGVDVVVDMVGGAPACSRALHRGPAAPADPRLPCPPGELLEPAIRSLNWDGRAVVVGFASGAIPQVPANLLLVKNVAVSGLFFGAHLQHDPNAVRASAEQLVRWWLLGEIKPHVGARLPLAQVNEAFALIEGRGTTGKVVLEP